jgi:hypothetical protein
VVVQAAWVPEAEHGALYNLVGQGYKVDAGRKRVTGPLVAQGRDTGVKIEIRAGGPAIGFQNAASLMYQDRSITLGQVATDDAISLAPKTPTVAVVAPFELSPLMIMWSPQEHPDWNTLVDVGQTDTKVLYFKGSTYMEYLIGSGILRRSQVDGSYDGSPATFLASGGKIAQQGFATNEPFIYEQALPQWRKPVKFQLIHDSGYPIYPEAVVVRGDAKDQLAPCLRKLVPIIQQSQVDYIKQPDATNKLIVQLVKAYKGFPYSAEQAAFSVQQQRQLGMVDNGTDGTLGNFDMKRVQRVLEIVTPILTAQKAPVKQGLTPEALATNEFIDPKIGVSQ